MFCKEKNVDVVGHQGILQDFYIRFYLMKPPENILDGCARLRGFYKRASWLPGRNPIVATKNAEILAQRVFIERDHVNTPLGVIMPWSAQNSVHMAAYKF